MNINLSHNFSVCSIALVELITRHRWWTNHSQAVSKSGKIPSLNSISISSSLVGFTVFGGMGREPKKTPPLRLPDLALICGYLIHPTLSKVGKHLMIYSFLIAPKGLLLSNLSNPQIVRCHSNSVKEAKAKLKGFSVALISRLPIGGAI
jgi:hypothetical protein